MENKQENNKELEMIPSDIVLKVNTGDVSEPLDDILDLESVISYYAQISNELEYYKALEQKRKKEMSLVKNKKENLQNNCKRLIQNTLTAFNAKLTPFPGVGKVNLRNVPEKYNYDDTEMLAFLQKRFKQEELQKYTQVEIKLIKPEVKKLLKNLDKKEDLPDFVEKEPSRKSVTIKLEKDEQPGDGQSLSNMFSKATNPVAAQDSEISEDELLGD